MHKYQHVCRGISVYDFKWGMKNVVSRYQSMLLTSLDLFDLVCINSIPLHMSRNEVKPEWSRSGEGGQGALPKQ